MLCWNCKKEIDASDAFCRHCGHGQGDRLTWYYKPFWIAVLTVFALGPFSLWLVWKTPRLGKAGKAVATVLVLLYTAYLVVATKRMVDSVIAAMSLMGNIQGNVLGNVPGGVP